MKKIITLLSFIVVSIFVQSSNAQFLNIEWSSDAGFVRADGVTELLAPGTAAYAQLIWTPSGIAAAAFPGAGVGGDNVVLDTVVIPYLEADPYGSFDPVFTQISFASGFVFARVFDRGSDNLASIVAGSAYYQAPLLANVSSDELTYQEYNINSGTANIPGFNTDVLSLVVIPEPSVMALLGLGGLMLAIRRQRMAA
jgi:hypothetical protein